MSETTKINLPVEAIRAYCETQLMQRLSLLGPAFDDWLRPDTDIGLLVEYAPGAPIGYFAMAQQEIDLGEIIGRKVDLRTQQEINRYCRKQLVDTAAPIYEPHSSD
ncbi:MAG: nucleotidyltransferase [Chloroflexi bacterium]|nr:nucleotidyltransferase [Chloroflexota bacterium]